jgi:hypothetical protein
MCTVTFSPRRRGYVLAMNRDELLTRPAGLPPVRKTINDSTVLFPSEPGGGTWVSVNDSGVTFALINWYALTERVKGETVSRGNVVHAAGTAIRPDAVETVLAELPLKQINPFRLIAIFPVTKDIIQWQWNLRKLMRENHRWKAQQWISSGFDEPMAQRLRRRAFRQALTQNSVGSLRWLRRLHRSHSPQSGPFSTCMHRADAATVSYIEVVVSPTEATMWYHAGSPCQCSNFRTQNHLISLGGGLRIRSLR